MVTPCGFESHLSHQKKTRPEAWSFFGVRRDSKGRPERSEGENMPVACFQAVRESPEKQDASRRDVDWFSDSLKSPGQRPGPFLGARRDSKGRPERSEGENMPVACFQAVGESPEKQDASRREQAHALRRERCICQNSQPIPQNSGRNSLFNKLTNSPFFGIMQA